MIGVFERTATLEGINIIRVRRNLKNSTVIIGFSWEDDAYEVVVPSSKVDNMEEAYHQLLDYTRLVRSN